MSEPNPTSRRDFLAQSAKIAAVAGMIGGTSCSMNRGPAIEVMAGPNPPQIKPDQVIRLGFVGVGGRGQNLLDATLKQKNVSIKAIADPYQDHADMALDKIKKAFNETPQHYRGEQDYKKLLARDDIDALLLAVPPDLHGPFYLECFAAGKHFYGEKPMCIEANQADALVKAQEKNPQVVAQIGFQRRCSNAYKVAVDRINEGMIGDPFEVRGGWRIAAGPYGLPPKDGKGTSIWFGRRKRSGDWMLEQACHTWDVLCWVAGTTPLAASGWGRNDIFKHLDPERDVTDMYMVHLQFPKGMFVDFEHNWCCPFYDEGRYVGIFERFCGPKGGISLGFLPADCKYYPRDPKAKAVEIVPNKGDSTQESVDAFFHAMRTGTRPPSGVENGRMATMTGLLVKKAVYERRRVEMKEITG